MIYRTKVVHMMEKAMYRFLFEVYFCTMYGKIVREKVLLLLDKLLKMADISLKLISTTYSCVLSGAKHGLPSASQGTMWKTFH